MYCLLNHIYCQYFVINPSGLAAGDGVWTQPEWNQHRLRRLWRTCRRHHPHQHHQRYCQKPWLQTLQVYSSSLFQQAAQTTMPCARDLSLLLQEVDTYHPSERSYRELFLLYFDVSLLTSRLLVHITNIHIPQGLQSASTLSIWTEDEPLQQDQVAVCSDDPVLFSKLTLILYVGLCIRGFDIAWPMDVYATLLVPLQLTASATTDVFAEPGVH